MILPVRLIRGERSRSKRYRGGHRLRGVGVLLVLLFFAGNRTAKGQRTAPADPALSGSHGALPILPKLPQLQVNVLMPNTTGYLTVKVRAGSDLQKAINSASCNPHGTILQLQHGASFTGAFNLPNKSCAPGQWILIESDASPSVLPAAGVRVNPSDTPNMPTIIENQYGVPAFTVAMAATNYRLMFLEIKVLETLTAGSPGAIVAIGSGSSAQNTAALQPSNIILDRVYIHGSDNPPLNTQRGIEMECQYCAVINSYISEIHWVGVEAQAIAAYNSTGPWLVDNNYLSAAGENILVGGATTTIPNAVPSDLTITHNYFFKPLSWNYRALGKPSGCSDCWTVKNILELKIAQRVLIQANVFENNWVDAQDGFAFLITPRSQFGTVPWAVVQDVTFTYNIMRHTASGMNIAGQDAGDPPQLIRGKRVLIQNSLFDDVNGPAYGGGDGRLFQILGAADAITIDHNTGFQSGPFVMVDGTPTTNFVYQNNLTPHNLYGAIGSGFGPGIPSLNAFFPGYVFSYNVIENILPSGVPVSAYPPNNFFPVTWTGVRFANQAEGDYRLCQRAGNPVASCPGASRYANSGSDAKDIGVDIAGLNTAIAGVI